MRGRVFRIDPKRLLIGGARLGVLLHIAIGIAEFAMRGSIIRLESNAFVYVLEGQIVMQLKGQAAVTLKPGQTFYEGPTDVHVVGRNASNTEPARFVVVLLKGKGAPLQTPVKE